MPTHAVKIADEIGYPVMIKASAGGGGKGMRIAWNDARGRARASSARRSEAEVLLRRRPHVHREIHRRSAPHRNPGARRQARQRHLSRRARMLDPAPQPEGHRGGAVAVARRGDAQGDGRAGRARWPRPSTTIAPARSSSSSTRTGTSIFLEMNTRLQVEHPVTELITGIDLVEQMIRVAAGEKLADQAGRRQAERLGGREPHLCRRPVPQLPAVDRPADALPPAGGRHGGDVTVRNDTGVFEGGEISMFYDPMIAKLVHLGADRAEAIDAMSDALDAFRHRRHPAQHSVPFGADAASALARRATVDGFIAEEYPGRLRAGRADEGVNCSAGSRRASPCELLRQRPARPPYRPACASFGQLRKGLGCPDRRRLCRRCRDPSSRRIDPDSRRGHQSTAAAPVSISSNWRPGDAVWHGTIGDRSMYPLRYAPVSERLAHRLARHVGCRPASCRRLPPRLDRLMPVKQPPDTSNLLLCPMPGLVVSIAVAEGQEVKAGETLAVGRGDEDGERAARRSGPDHRRRSTPNHGDSLAVDAVIMEFAMRRGPLRSSLAFAAVRRLGATDHPIVLETVRELPPSETPPQTVRAAAVP